MNISKEELKVMSELKRDESVKILRADKGNATVILDAKINESKISNT